MSNRSRPRYTETELRAAIEASLSYAETLRRLGLRPNGRNPQTIKRHAELWNISTDHFDPTIARDRALRAAHRKKPLEEILIEGSTYSRGHLKRRLYADGLKERRCELCGQGEEWNGARMSLILDHINGVGDDHRLENLRVVCPNCAATLTTHCGRNKPVPEPRSCAYCGETFQPETASQRYCSRACGVRSPGSRDRQPNRRKVERPPYEQLRADLARMSYVAVGRKYDVSDNAVRKWLRWYERELGDEPA